MKLRHPGLIRLAGLVAAGTVRSLFSTVRTREYLFDPAVLPTSPLNTHRCIYAFWHEALLYLAGRYGHHKNIAILISRHADGELIAQACSGFRRSGEDDDSRNGSVQAVHQAKENAPRFVVALLQPSFPQIEKGDFSRNISLNQESCISSAR